MADKRKLPVRGGRNAHAKNKRLLPVWVLIAADIALIGISLLIFAYFHHVRPQEQEAVGLTSQRVSSGNTYAISVNNDLPEPTEAVTTVVPSATTEPEINNDQAAEIQPTPEIVTPEPATPEPVPEDTIGYFGYKFADKFTDGTVIRGENSYQSGNLNITIDFYDVDGIQFYVADIYIKDISCLQTTFGNDKYGKGYTESVSSMSERTGAVIAVNGDYYGARSDGVVIRNGVLYRRDKYPDRDVCVLFWDGTMKCYTGGKFDADAAIERGAYQAWNFGPALLDENGMPKERFNSDVVKENPRTVIGYYEPGHYCLVVVDGRSDDSKGITMKDLSKLVYNLGCVQAYNLDGGQSSVMAAGGTVINNAYNGGRDNSDAIVIVEGSY